MRTRPLDTTKEALEIQRQVLRRLSPARRIEMVFELTDELYRIIVAGIKARHPEFKEEQVLRERNRLLWGDDLYTTVYGNRDKLE